MSEHESDGMWQNYLKEKFGVAIKSTYERFTKALEPASQIVHVGKVNYKDYKNDFIPYD